MCAKNSSTEAPRPPSVGEEQQGVPDAPRHQHEGRELGDRPAHEPVDDGVVRRHEEHPCDPGDRWTGAEHPAQAPEARRADDEKQGYADLQREHGARHDRQRAEDLRMQPVIRDGGGRPVAVRGERGPRGKPIAGEISAPVPLQPDHAEPVVRERYPPHHEEAPGENERARDVRELRQHLASGFEPTGDRESRPHAPTPASLRR